MNKFNRTLLLLITTVIVLVSTISSKGQENKDLKALEQCSANLSNNILTIENDLISRRYKWNSGNLISLDIKDKKNNFTWILNNNNPDCFFPNCKIEATDGQLKVTKSLSTKITPAYLMVDITHSLGKLEVKRVFRIYPDCPAIACDYYLRGDGDFLKEILNSMNKQPIRLEHLSLPGKHWRYNVTEFYDRTDITNNLIRNTTILAYRSEKHLRGNILFADNQLENKGFFILKESPLAYAQLNYPGYDFSCSIGNIEVVGMGVQPEFLDDTDWVKYYGFVTGVTSNNELSKLSALRKYQEKIRIRKPGRDELIMMNTWGDRGRDAKISEKFAIDELYAGAKLGITHFSLDDGWQVGRSGASVYGGSLQNIWDDPNYWKPKPDKFPNGFYPVIKLGKKLGIEICLWFNPSADSSYAHWENDADILINFYKKYGIRTFKIDGVILADKQAEINLRKMFKKVIDATEQNVVFQLDVTGVSKRFGYFYFNEYGNLFLENRYTDWGNYYPYWTLRNLWMLSKYIPPQNIQIEFLNKWRNKDKYPDDDIFAPYKIPFDYIFAITMMAEPLAWFEGSGLPEEAFNINSIISTYKKYWSDLHSGEIFPIGNEPNGKNWTGFQSIKEYNGYFLIFREHNDKNKEALSTWITPEQEIKLELILGQGKNFETTTDKEGRITFELPEENTFALYKYILIGNNL